MPELNDTEDTIIDKRNEIEKKIDLHWQHVYYHIASIIDKMILLEEQEEKKQQQQKENEDN